MPRRELQFEHLFDDLSMNNGRINLEEKLFDTRHETNTRHLLQRFSRVIPDSVPPVEHYTARSSDQRLRQLHDCQCCTLTQQPQVKSRR